VSGRRGWVPGAAIAVASVVAAVTFAASWWAVPFVVGVAYGMAGARGAVPGAYVPGWRRSTLLVTAAAVLAGGVYAFSVGPWGPAVPVVVLCAIALAFGLVAIVLDASRTPASDQAQEEVAKELRTERRFIR
jgi:hypothetical protein